LLILHIEINLPQFISQKNRKISWKLNWIDKGAGESSTRCFT